MQRLVRDRIDAAVRERSGHLGQILGINIDGALLGVEAGRLVRIAPDALVGIHQQAGNRLVALIGIADSDLYTSSIHRELAAGKAAIVASGSRFQTSCAGELPFTHSMSPQWRLD